MFNYQEFKKDMINRGHEVHKKGSKIIISPNNNYKGYSLGFTNASEIIEGYEDYLKFKRMEHYNTWIYSAEFQLN